MLPVAGPGERVLWGIIVVLVLGYLGGTWLNRQRSKAIGKWLQDALGKLGKRSAWKWIGTMSSGAEVNVADAARPFRQIQVTYLLLTRELLPLWGIELLRGKRDLLIVRANLRQEPRAEFEVVPIQGKLRRTLDEHAGDQPWQWSEGPAGLGVAIRGTDGDKTVARLAAFLGRYGQHVQRLSLRQRQPNLILFAHLSGLEKAPAADLFGSLRSALEAPGSDKD